MSCLTVGTGAEAVVPDLATWLDIDPDVVARARHQVLAGGLVLLAMSGRLASGKDTIADQAMRCAPGAVVTVRFGAGVVEEVENLVTQLADLHAAGVTSSAAVHTCASSRNLSTYAVQKLVDLVWELLADYGTAVIRGRTVLARQAFQAWGTARRAADPLVWVRRGVKEALRAVTSGRSVVIPDVRTRVEADAVRAAGFLLVRVDASAEVRRRRLLERDALVLDGQTTEHPTETELDDYEEFDVRVTNDERLATANYAVSVVVDALRQRRRMPGR